jgi:hypothetical protein
MDNDYELDYFIIYSDINSVCTDCGHCICALHYDKKEYYYDSGYFIDDLKCDRDDIELPCSLIKQNWTQSITNGENSFCTLPCRKIDNHITPKMLKKQQISTKYSNKLCYTNENIIYCYVNKEILHGGKGKNNINRNTNVTRKVYFDKKLNKYYVNYNNNKIYLSK